MTIILRVSVAVLALLASAGSIYAADLTTAAGLTYSDATILEVTKTTIKFKLQNETIVTKALSEIKKIQTGDLKQFDAADELAAAGKYAESLPLYQVAATNAKGEAMAMLCIARTAAAKERIENPQAAAKPAATTSPAISGKCPSCKGVGATPCTACTNTNGLATGLSKCSKCTGTGLVTCRGCGGAFGARCTNCGGTGSFVERSGSKTGTVESHCKRCGGTGWVGANYPWDRPCALCFETSHRGKSSCLNCKGTGREGACPVCNGTKKVACSHCHGEAPKKSDAQPAANAPADPVSGPSPVTIPTKDTALASPQALKLFLQMGGPKHPQKDSVKWSKLTSFAQDEAMEAYNKDLVAWQANKSFKGKTVTWTLALADIQKADAGKGYIAKLSSPDGFVLPVSIPASAKDNIVSWKKDDSIVVTGKLEEYELTDERDEIHGERRSGLSIKLVETSTKLAGK